MVLVTGPTGSGKTTTLYAALNEIKSEEDKIITIEDPVEYQIRGITQIPVNEKKGLTFARGLRSILPPETKILASAGFESFRICHPIVMLEIQLRVGSDCDDSRRAHDNDGRIDLDRSK